MIIKNIHCIFAIILILLAMNTFNPARGGDKWREYEDNGLLYELQKGIKIGEIAYKHNRTIAAINSRIKKIALNMINNDENINDIVNTTKLSKEIVLKLINKKYNPIMMTNGSWNKTNLNKKQHIQNMKDKLHMMKYGYWFKTKDILEDLDKDYQLKKFKQLQRGHPSQFKYTSSSNYPKIILQKNDDPPNFNNVDTSINNNIFTIHDKLDGNTIIYKHVKYIHDYQPKTKHNSENIDNEQLYGLIDGQLEIEIKSLESMIYLFENI